jgi:hypothetical protein
MTMRKHLPTLLAALLAASSAVAADDVGALLARADQAFANAEYDTALALYKKLEPQLTDKSKLSMMQERMRFASRQLAMAATQPAATTQPAVDPSLPNPAQRKKFTRPPEGQALETTLHELGNFEFKDNDPATIPADVKELSGAKVRITGQMLPLDQAAKVGRFLLVNDLLSCCYGTAPKLQNTVLVKLADGATIAPTNERIVVEGTFKVSVRKEDGYVLGIFELTPTSVKYAPE